MVTDQAGLRVGDCVAVEHGGFNNLRLVDDSRCARNMKPTRPAVNQGPVARCAETEEGFDGAERRMMRSFCGV